MGFTPRQIGDMSLWQIHAAAAGWAEANGGGGGLDADEIGELSRLVDGDE